MASFATQALLYRQHDWRRSLSGVRTGRARLAVRRESVGRLDGRRVSAQAAWPRDPHSVCRRSSASTTLTGGLVDGPVYRSIYQNLRASLCTIPTSTPPFNTGFIVYHDDIGDYSTNEPIMDGTANLSYLLAAMSGGR